MLSEEFDKKIVESLENRSPEYHEHSWEKMKKLLDKRLPQKKKERRRFIFLLFIFLLAGGGAAIFIFNTGNENNQKKQPIANNNISTTDAIREKLKEVPTVIINQKEISWENTQTSQSNHQQGKPLMILKSTHNKTVKKTNFNNSSPIKLSSNPVNNKIPRTVPGISHNIIPSEKESTKQLTSKSEAKPVAEDHKTYLPVKTDHQKKLQEEVKSIPLPAVSEKTIASEEKNNVVQSEAKKAKNYQRTFLRNISFSLSAGPDVSVVGFSKAGKLKLAYGAGISYKISNHFSIGSGFYVERKIYTALPGDYNPPSNFWNYYPNLKSISADCKVYEVPLNINYHFNQTKTQSWFISTGASSVFLKKEVYDYYFKPVYSTQYINYSKTFENKNRHYFSILNLSGGYAKKINSHLTFQAGTYMKIAMRGVGYGKVKLNSGGILFTASFNPFNKK